MAENTWETTEKLILNILSLAAQLHQQLSQEAELLKTAPKAELLDAITTNKKQLVSQLEGLNAQFCQILVAAGFPDNQDGINLYFESAKASGLPVAETAAHWRQIQLICNECKLLNEQNGASIELLAQHAKRSLDIIKGKPQGSGTYGRDGSAQCEALSHTLTFYL